MNQGPFTILLVEDNPAHAELVFRSFEEHGMAGSLLHVQDGAAALAFLRGQGAWAGEPVRRPHVVLLDLRLPKVDGLEVLREMKEDEALRQIPVVILTTSAAEGDVTAAYHRHVNSYLVKPVAFEAFSELMGQLGLYWLTCNRRPE